MMISNNNSHIITMSHYLQYMRGCLGSVVAVVLILLDFGKTSSSSRFSRKPCNFVEVSNEIACPAGCKGPTRQKLSSYQTICKQPKTACCSLNCLLEIATHICGKVWT